MASVVLDRAWLSLAGSSLSVNAFTSDRSELLSTPGEVRRMANGRLRTVKRAGTSTTLSVTLRYVDADSVQQVRSWVGQTVLFRDAWGRKMFGVFFSVDITDFTDRGGQDVKLVLFEVTFSEAV